MSFDPARLCPTVTGYRYVTDAGLVRTSMEDGVIRQRRQWAAARLTLDLRFVLSLEEVYAADAFLAEIGPEWWTINLITGYQGGAAELHTVRLISNPRLAAVDKTPYYEYLFTVETAPNGPQAESSS